MHTTSVSPNLWIPLPAQPSSPADSMELTPCHQNTYGGAHQLDQLTPWLNSIMEQHHIPGMAIGVVKDGQTIWNRGFGFRDLEKGQKVSEETPFMLASISKLITATAAMHWIQSTGKSWDEPIDHFIDFKIQNPSFDKTQITLRHLATHASSIQDRELWIDPREPGSLYTQGDCKTPLKELLQAYLTPDGSLYHPDNFLPKPPGQSYSYTNFGIDLLAYAIERDTGMPFDLYCNKHLFEPLKMNATGWHLSDHRVENVALPYEWQGHQFGTFGHYGYPNYPSGHLRASSSDLCKFIAAIDQGAKGLTPSLLGKEAIHALLDADSNEVDHEQALGWYWEHQEGIWFVGHEGVDSGVSTSLWLDPETNTGLTILFNVQGDESDKAREIISRALIERLYPENMHN